MTYIVSGGALNSTHPLQNTRTHARPHAHTHTTVNLLFVVLVMVRCVLAALPEDLPV